MTVSVTVQSHICGDNVFINDFTYLAVEQKKFFQVGLIRVRPMHNLKMLQLSSDVNCHPILQ